MVSACGGNDGAASCTAWYPGTRTDTISVNGLDTSDTSLDYNSLAMMEKASRGGMAIRTFTGYARTTPVIDLAAPGVFRLYFSHPSTIGGDTGYQSEPRGGCSYATPVVTAAAGSLRNAFKTIGWT
ncbi:MAG: S8 family serine peptidase, partial [Polyangiaceae bacterium]|nr:S8 family serine peptidase [Polyangiaceae bacterium]